MGEKKAIKELKRNRDFINKPADKGNAVVLMNRDQCVWEGLRQLAVTQQYCPLEEPMYPQTMVEVKPILDEMCEKGIINGRQKKYLLGTETPRPRKFYLLPKIHKRSEGLGPAFLRLLHAGPSCPTAVTKLITQQNISNIS